MTVKGADSGPVIWLNQDLPEHFCRLAVDVMLCSMAEVYRGRLLVVIPTRMGQDGLAGGRKVIDQGGSIISQDEKTNVIWGMPGAVATAGLCCAVLPLDDIATKIRGISGRAAA